MVQDKETRRGSSSVAVVTNHARKKKRAALTSEEKTIPCLRSGQRERELGRREAELYRVTEAVVLARRSGVTDGGRVRRRCHQAGSDRNQGAQPARAAAALLAMYLLRHN